jgi:hypothetical protein
VDPESGLLLLCYQGRIAISDELGREVSGGLAQLSPTGCTGMHEEEHLRSPSPAQKIWTARTCASTFLPVCLIHSVFLSDFLVPASCLTHCFLFFFLPHSPYSDQDKDKVVSKYQFAAQYGREEKANCAAQYDGCVVNFLDAWNGIVNFFS